jgi:hypothetical protein
MDVMSKKKGNTNNRHPIPSAPPTIKLGGKASALSASITTMERVIGSETTLSEIKIDSPFLDTLASSLPADTAASFSTWIDRFTSACKDLEKQIAAQVELEREFRAEAAATKSSMEVEQLSLEQRRKTLSEEEQRLAPRIQEIVSREGAANDRELSLVAREADARSGFDRLKQETLANLKEELRQIESTRSRLRIDIDHMQDTISAAVAEKVHELDERAQELEQKSARLDRERLRLAREQSSLDADREELKAEIDRAMAKERSLHQRELEQFQERIDIAYQLAAERSEQLSGFQAIAALLGDRPPESLIDELQESKRLIAQLRSSGSQADMENLRRENTRLHDTVAMLETQRAEILPELEQARLELHRNRMAARDLERMAIQKRAMEANQQLLGSHLNEIESRITKLSESSKAGSAFPELSKMDREERFQVAPPVLDVPSNLKDFAEELQQRIAQAEPDTRLYYPLADIRALLGGLAMSQLHVFQGISGTGKTSLAKAFAKAMGGSCTDIAVQAGWRDRDDLLGHYNSFEKRFYEKDCLQAIYQAQTPAWSDRCNVVLLDEMNLSRPEQYFAEFLSALEKNNAEERLITLKESELDDAPRLLRERRKVLVPRNLWFIGTANHDETTNELADKTYDRAHVMTLPRHEDTFQVKVLEPVRYSFSSLQERFETAISRHDATVKNLLAELQGSELTLVLEESFGLGWGNRFERQARRFIPVMMAAGATCQDALDHLLSTRVMRRGKVTGRYDISVEQLNQAEEALEALWKRIGGEGPVRSLAMIADDRRGKERGA